MKKKKSTATTERCWYGKTFRQFWYPHMSDSQYEFAERVSSRDAKRGMNKPQR